jgi:hypothetical protein
LSPDFQVVMIGSPEPMLPSRIRQALEAKP